MTWACWPNLSWSENWNGNQKWIEASEGTGPGVIKSDRFGEIRNLDLTGAYCFLRYSKGNSCYSRVITGFDGSSLQWDGRNFYTKNFTGEDGRKGSPWFLEKKTPW